MTVLISNILKLDSQTLGELDKNCCEHLSKIKYNVSTTVLNEDYCKAINEFDSSDLKFLDFPSNSVLQLTKKWKGFEKVFENSPDFVMWTDTSTTYPISLHGEKYSKIIGKPISSKEEYVVGVSDWLYNNFGYSIVRAAFRDKNAIYFGSVKGKHDVEMKFFPKTLDDKILKIFGYDEPRSSLSDFL